MTKKLAVSIPRIALTPAEAAAGLAGAPAISPATTRNASPAKSRNCMTFCKPLDSRVPATFSAVSATTPTAA